MVDTSITTLIHATSVIGNLQSMTAECRQVEPNVLVAPVSIRMQAHVKIVGIKTAHGKIDGKGC